MCPPGNTQTPDYNQTENYTVSSISLTSSPATTATTSKSTNFVDNFTSSTKCKGNVVGILHFLSTASCLVKKNKQTQFRHHLKDVCQIRETQLDRTEGRDHQGDSVTERVANNMPACAVGQRLVRCLSLQTSSGAFKNCNTCDTLKFMINN